MAEAGSAKSRQTQERIAVVGCGNMGGALVRGFCRAAASDRLLLFDTDRSRVQSLCASLGAEAAESAAQAASEADVVILAVKPLMIEEMLGEISAALSSGGAKERLVISIAAGVSLRTLQTALPASVLLGRAMPNLAAEVGEALTALYATDESALRRMESLFGSVGETIVLATEDEVSIATGLCGSGPAFVFSFIDALASGGVKMGLTRETALRMASQTVRGAAALVTELRHHPAALRDMVASPGGTTIEGLHVLETAGFTGTVMSAVEQSTRKAKG